jgi:S-adenosylmethionine-dependent methyltransferase
MEMAVREAVERLYDSDPAREWARMDRHRTEFAVTLRALREHLPPLPARVLDCGGGPGRYAVELARLGYAVTLFDLSTENLRLAQEKAAEAGVALAGYERGTATDLTRFPDGSFDAVLLMGPLYHLLDEEERLQALAEARRVLVSGGVLFAAFITRYAAHRYAAARYPTQVLAQWDEYERILVDGRLPPQDPERVSFVAYFAHPAEVAPLCWRAGLEVVTVLGVEGVVSGVEDYGVNDLSGSAWDCWADLNYRLAADPAIHGGVEHLLVVARRPRWREVLRRVARRMEAAGLHYKIVGGASLALHGLPLPVGDIDVEMDVLGAYQFQELFPAEAVRPVALSEGEAYRSHLGHFIFGGVRIEVMGDLQRRAGEGWVTTATVTETSVDLDGEPVRVSWLEEEALAYIRRGRLDRAAVCLPHCDHGRLLALLRGEQATGVL